jgi:hypothetical protein
MGLPPSRSFPEKRTSVLNEATDRNGYDVTSCRKRLGQGKADINEGRPAQTSYRGYRSPDRLGSYPVRLWPERSTGNADLVEDADILVLDP